MKIPLSQLKMARVLCVWSLCAVVRVALCADVPQGKVIWWGSDIHDLNTDKIYREQTNGVLESDEEIASNVIAIAGSHNHGLALRSDGTVIAVGYLFGGTLPAPAGLSNVESIAMSGYSCWGTKQDGTVVQWDREEYDYRTNVFLGLHDITAVESLYPGAMVDNHTYRYLALKKDGSVLSIRYPATPTPNFDPRTGRPMNDINPVEVDGRVLTNAAGVAFIRNTPIILRRDGTVIQLEPYMPQYRQVEAAPVMVNGQILSNVMSIAGGGLHCLALKSNGTVVAWGDDYAGVTEVPSGLSNVTAIAAAQNESLALKSDGTVIAWGNNYSGVTSVPSGLSNVVQIAAAGNFNMAITTGAVPASVFITPYGRLEEMARKADLIFKGQAISNERITNGAFTVRSMDVARTRFKVISVLQGEYTNNFVEFEHYSGWTPGGHIWRGGRWPAFYGFEPGQCYIVHAANLARKEEYSDYQPAANTTNKANEFREVADSSIQDDDGALRTLDTRPVETSSLREAAWNELNLLLNDSNSTNQLYAIHHLDSMSKLGTAWDHSEDFKHPKVMKVLQPFVDNTNDEVAIAAINCFGVGHECATQLVAYVPDLIGVANNSTYSVHRRITAIGTLAGNGAPAITNSLPRWLSDPSEHVRAHAVLLLSDFPGEFSEAALRERAADTSPRVRARVAESIGTGKFEKLLPILETLFKDPVGLTTKPPSLSMEEYGAGLGALGGDDANVHVSAGNALLKFGPDQVGGILKSNLNDARFRPDFLCEVAKEDAVHYIPQLVDMMETWRSNRLAEAKSNGFNPDMQLYISSPYYQAWESIYNYLTNLPPAEFSNGKMDHYLIVLEETGQGSGIEEPVKLYELYRRKGLNEQATNFRGEMEKKFAGWAIVDSFKQVDAGLTNSAGK